MRKYLPILIATGLLLAGCGGSQPEKADAPEDIVGIWDSTGGTTHARFDADGTYRLAPSLMLVNDPIYPPGEYWFEEGQLHIQPIDDPVCGEIVGVYEVWLTENGSLQFLAIEDSCDHREAVLQGVIDSETGEPSTEYRPVTDG